MSRHPWTLGVAWALAFTAGWLVWAWLNLGMVPVAVLVAALAVDLVRRQRTRETRPGLPRPVDGHRAAAYLAGILFVALWVGYRSDWLVIGGLGVSLAAKLYAIASDRRAAG